MIATMFIQFLFFTFYICSPKYNNNNILQYICICNSDIVYLTRNIHLLKHHSKLETSLNKLNKPIIKYF